MLQSIALIVCLGLPGLLAQDLYESGRFPFEGRVQGSASSPGSVTRLDSSAGYLITRH